MMDSSSQQGQVPASAIGNIADLKEGEILLPEFAAKTPDGILVDPAKIAQPGDFYRFIDSVFSSGTRFLGIDYANFLKLVHLEAEAAEDEGATLRLAADIVPFPPERKALYKTVKIAGDSEEAEYFFEPVSLEIREQVPLYGEPGEDGSLQVTGYEEKVRTEPTKLDPDEFVADMWTKGVRYGIDLATVRQTIAKGEMMRLIFARRLEATPGKDASIEEKSTALHRNDAPKVLASGKLDLRSYQNRYPQISQDAPLLKKIPRVLGKRGRKVSGETIEPEIPQDIDMSALAGPGTRLETGDDGGEYIASSIEGFLTLDPATNQISITEKIISKEGVSSRTTGDLVLSGDEYEEYGEVQEGRVVKGKHMTFHANVYGSVMSEGGKIELLANFSGGQAKSPCGTIVVQGRASQATLEAPNGEITIKQAEGSTIIGSRVKIESAVRCQVIADTLEIGKAEGCTLVGKSVRIGASAAHKSVETVVSVLTPDFSFLDGRIDEIKGKVAEAGQGVEAKRKEMQELRSQPELSNYLVLDGRIRKGEVKLAPAQLENWRKVSAKFFPMLKRLQDLNNAIKGAQEEIAGLNRQIGEIEKDRVSLSEGYLCEIEEVTGDTFVRTMRFVPEHAPLSAAQFQEIGARLREPGSQEWLFKGDSGVFIWQFYKPEEPAADAAEGGEPQQPA